ncbi:uncharacterized protein B0H64DRAFT_48018 [Chaetomium fimeti]|uniref:Uncharacterized protein n=1 Tax=Chaetomium fimeti TaxID=1854472 RepID=A0AAE0LMG4_9PEZI|nr:hypothetical protein B0H64DRAFT_48018 [Chaetomium fimeti]
MLPVATLCTSVECVDAWNASISLLPRGPLPLNRCIRTQTSAALTIRKPSTPHRIRYLSLQIMPKQRQECIATGVFLPSFLVHSSSYLSSLFAREPITARNQAEPPRHTLGIGFLTPSSARDKDWTGWRSCHPCPTPRPPFDGNQKVNHKHFVFSYRGADVTCVRGTYIRNSKREWQRIISNLARFPRPK